MRGEIIGIWTDTWREIWSALEEHAAAPDDMFCELFRLLSAKVKEPSAEQLISDVVCNPLLSREAFDLALQGLDIDGAAREAAFAGVEIGIEEDWSKRKEALQHALGELTGDPDGSRVQYESALSQIVHNPEKRSEALQWIVTNTVNDRHKSRERFSTVSAQDFPGERAVIEFLEDCHPLLEELGGDALSNCYFNLLETFLEKFSLRYDLRRPCILCPTLPGVFSSLTRQLKAVSGQDAHLNALMKDFEETIRDLRVDHSEGRIKTCIQKQINLLEAIGRACPGVTERELGGICNQVPNWPHNAVRASLKNLYGFASDYPGIRHGGTAQNALRAVGLLDLVALSIILTGFAPYLIDQMDTSMVYNGA